MTVHEEYTKIIEERYAHLQSQSYEMQADYYGAYYGPYQYRTEVYVLRYVKEHPDATLKEVADYFDLITPDGLPPGDDGSDLLDDDWE
jgi:hypothetical protein